MEGCSCGRTCNRILIRVSCRARTPMPQSHGLQGGWGTRLYRLGFCKADTLQGRAASHFPGVYHSVNGACRPPVLHGKVCKCNRFVNGLFRDSGRGPGFCFPRSPTRSQSSHEKKSSAPLQTPAWRADRLTGTRTASAGTPGGIPCALRSSRGLYAISRRGSGIAPRVATRAGPHGNKLTKYRHKYHHRPRVCLKGTRRSSCTVRGAHRIPAAWG